MRQNGRKIVIVGAGIAGLCTAAYALKCGYEVEVLEMSEMAGGLATSWRRGPYTFETCLHWLVGSRRGGEMHGLWQEVFDIDRLTFVDAEEFVRMEDEAGGKLSIYTNVDRLEAELLRRAPQDRAAIRGLVHAVRSLSKFRLLDPSQGLGRNLLNILHDAPIFPLFGRISGMSGREFGSRFSDPLLRHFFGGGDMGQMSAIALVYSLAWMNNRNAGYCLGGSQAIIRLIEEEIARLGGKISFHSRVERILVENGSAVGVELADGRSIQADWVISAADGYSTLFNMLGGKYLDPSIQKTYDQKELFPSYLQVSLGVARDLSGEPSAATRLLGTPMHVDPQTDLDHISFRFFHFDPTFAPPGGTAVTSFLPTRNFAYWTDLRRNDLAAYRAEKQRVADAVIGLLEKRIPGIRSAIEVTDVSTPATVVRYTGNWKGSMEGWLPMPGAGFKPLPNALPGLRRFLMAGQWVMPGGGLPSGLFTARSAIKSLCKQDRLPFDLHAADQAKADPGAV